MTRRKHISWKTRCASATLALMNERDPGWYGDAKLMTEDQFLSLFHFDHNILHSSGHLDADRFWNLAPMLIRAHREKTKIDAKVVAKSRRIRSKNAAGAGNHVTRLREVPLQTGPDEVARGKLSAPSIRPLSGPHKLSGWDAKRTIQSRGFDKTRRRKMDGTVIKRER